MTRILTDEELKHLTIPRLQELLKATRARAHAAAHDICECCGEDLVALGVTEPHPQAPAKHDYYERVKKELQRRQA